VSTITACAEPTRNIEKGDRDYPISNPNPKSFIFLHGTIEPSLDVKASAVWSVPYAGIHAEKTKDSCTYYINRLEGVTERYTVSEPLTLEREGDSFSVKVARDGMLPGRCGWGLFGIQISVGSQGKFGSLSCKKRTRSLQSTESIVDCKWFDDSRKHLKYDIFWVPKKEVSTELHFLRGN
jgi:hypothetical protein